MTSISAMPTQAQRLSPRDMLQSELTSQIAAGEISSTDEAALTAALDTIDSALSSSRPAAGSKPPSPEEMQAKIDDLIQQQVESGALTEDQAAELSSVFSEAFAGGPKGPGGPGGPRGPGGPGGAGAIEDSENSEESDVTEMLAKFLEQLQEQLGGSSYGEDGASSTSSTTSVLFSISA